MIKIKLLTDFIDFYDFMFHSEGVTWERFCKPGLSRVKMFEYLSYCGFAVPSYGYCRSLVPNLVRHLGTTKFKIVIHTNDHSCYGDGKILLDAEEALVRFPDRLGVHYIENSGVTYTYLKVGMRNFGLKYTSKNDWRSNCGDFKVDLVCEGKEDGLHRRIKYPVFSIDYVVNDKKLYAIDLNVSPKLRGTGLEYHLKPLAMYEQVSAFVKSL